MARTLLVSTVGTPNAGTGRVRTTPTTLHEEDGVRRIELSGGAFAETHDSAAATRALQRFRFAPRTRPKLRQRQPRTLRPAAEQQRAPNPCRGNGTTIPPAERPNRPTQIMRELDDGSSHNPPSSIPTRSQPNHENSRRTMPGCYY